MKRVAWVTDSSAVLDEELKNNKDVYVLPVHIIIDGQSYLDGIDLTTEEMVRHIDKESSLTSSQPSIGDFKHLYDQLAEEYDYIFSFHISDKLSGTYSTSVQAAEMVDIPVFHVDTHFLSYPLTFLLKKAIKIWEVSYDSKAVVDAINAMKLKLKVFVWIGSLQQLQNSGRLNTSSYYLGSLLNIKPIVTFQDGSMHIKTKVRTWKKATDKIQSYLKQSLESCQIDEVFMLYGKHIGQTSDWSQMIERVNKEIAITTHPLGTALCLHAGVETVGIGWMEK
jgi:DegV family protein with EDD domain